VKLRRVLGAALGCVAIGTCMAPRVALFSVWQEGGKLVERLEEYRRAEGRYPEDLTQLDAESRFVPASDSRGIEYRPSEDGSEFLLTCFAFGRSGLREAYSSRTGSWRSFD
jgi:hypothetical protein